MNASSRDKVSQPSPASGDIRPWIGLNWLVRVRWAAIVLGAGLLFAAVSANLLPRQSVIVIAGVLGITFVSNVVLAGMRMTHVGRRFVGALLVVDVLSLAVVLGFSGGAMNPCSTFMLLPVTTAAIVLSARWSFAIGLLAILSFAAMFFFHAPLTLGTAAHHHGAATPVDGHLYGMLLSFSVSTVAIVHLVAHVSTGLRQREGELMEALERATQTRQVAALSTLAAGAAHELSTPLGTIAVVGEELERVLQDAEAGVREDVALIRAEVRRCRSILDRLAVRATDSTRALASRVRPSELACDAVTPLPATLRDRVRIDIADDASFDVQREAVVQVLEILVQNALDADHDGTVGLDVRRSATHMIFSVQDRGPGMSTATLRRAMEPFFTTKDVGQGMGLGLYVARAFMEQMGGTLRLEPREGGGIVAFAEVPR